MAQKALILRKYCEESIFLVHYGYCQYLAREFI